MTEGKRRLAKGIERVCSGILECSPVREPYRSAIRKAEAEVGRGIQDSEAAANIRGRLIEAIKLNLINRKEYPFEVLRRKFDLPLGYWYFAREKQRFCQELAKQIGLI